MLYGEENHGYKNATRRVAGKKIKGRGGKKIKSDSRIYTPDIMYIIVSVVQKDHQAAITYAFDEDADFSTFAS